MPQRLDDDSVKKEAEHYEDFQEFIEEEMDVLEE